MLSCEQRIKWFHQARFGMFIHWGLYSILGRGELVMLKEAISPEEYAKLAWQFNPKKFNADNWVALAQEAGMKYMVLTTRHHEGFCLFDSKASDFTSVKTAAKRDFVAEYVKAARQGGMKVGLYYSLLDWRSRGFHVGQEKDPKSCEDMVAQAHAQVRELMTNYGKIDILWYDGGWNIDFSRSDPDIAKFWRSRELNSMVRKLQPHILINNRSGINEDFDTPEGYIAASAPGRNWESCMSIGDTCAWGYTKNNPNMKTTVQLIHNLVDAANGEGNYLLNIGPKPDGTVRIEEVKRLKEMGKWLKKNNESIYGSERCPFGSSSSGNGHTLSMIGTTTAKGNTVYLHIYRWPGEEGCIINVGTKVKSAYLLATGKKLKVSQKSDGHLFVSGMPKKCPDLNDTVVVLKMAGKPQACQTRFF